MSQQIITNYDSSIKAITPEGVEFVLSPVGFPIRTISYAIDKIIQWTVLITIILLFDFFRWAMGFWMFFLFMFVLDWFYHVIFELAFRGQSPGKRLMGIRVVKNDGSPVDPASSFLRNLLRFADTMLCFFHIAFISIAASSGFRRLGDWAGGTLVVYSSMAKNTARSPLSRLLEKYESVTPPKPLTPEEKQAILNFARRYQLLGEARANEIAGIYAPNAAYLMGIARKISGEL